MRFAIFHSMDPLFRTELMETEKKNQNYQNDSHKTPN
jgi:hypothetical protein